MRITFALPAPIRIPMGGAAVVYRYAGMLTARGHEVTVVSPRRTEAGLRGVVMDWAVQIRDRIHGVGSDAYYSAPGVRSLVVPRLGSATVPPGDVVIATGVQTARPVATLPRSAGVPVYFIQGDETFADPSARATWHLPMARLTCATWLADAVRAAGETVEAVLPNAIDPADFALDRPLGERFNSVIALYHRHPVKGPDVLAEALGRIQRARPDLPIRLFAARPPSHRLPESVEVHIRPALADLRALYNASSVLLHPSRSEGWPLVPMEAAACGCAIVACSNPGVSECFIDGVSMRAVPVGDGAALGQAALDVLGDEALRVRLAEAGRDAVARTSWSASADLLEETLLRIAEGGA